ncbi:MAG: ImmA/IrrE family metallo-endopeptidase [Cyanobacteria bacterium REEB65]|nr:ImmA/IrrE family metallo-endopeptidase [Cyanobacteria bacterium REEB65]
MTTNNTTTDRTAEAMAKLEEGIKALTSSDAWERYLRMQAAFHRYSFSNTVLIYSQMPDATRVAGIRTWNKLGRSVIKGQKAIWILAPVAVGKKADQDLDGDDADETQRRVVAFRPVPVFDLSQTEGDELPSPVCMLTGNTSSQLFEHLATFSEKRGCPLTVEAISGGANGFFDPTANRIVVREGLAPDHACKTLAHEIAHSILHRDLEIYREHRGDCELEAESASFVVLAHHGINAGQYSFGYVSSWQGGGEAAIKALKASAQRIQVTAKAIIDSIEETIADDDQAEQLAS